MIIHRFPAALAMLLINAAALAQPATTIITHGFSAGDKGIWVPTMADAIVARAGHGSIYRYDEANGLLNPVITASTDGSSDVIVVIFNWVPESAGVNEGSNWLYAQAAGDALHGVLRSPRYAGPPGPNDLAANRLLHFIGHSRGATVNSHAVRRLAGEGVPVDQVTTLDPHPVNGTLDFPLNLNWGDSVPVKYNNVAFADNFYRADGGFFNAGDFDGIPLTDAANTLLSESALDCCAYSLSHLDVHLWYHGTIDTSDAPCDGEQCIDAEMRQTWWPLGWTQTGFFLSHLGGGSASRPAQPVGADPGAVAAVFNGDFEQATVAGWSYHGGGGDADILNSGGFTFVRLSAASGTTRTHNRFFLSPGTHELHLDFRVTTASPTESITVSLIDDQDVAHAVTTLGAEAAGSFQPATAALPANEFGGRAWRLRLQTSTASPLSVVDIDNISIIAIAPPVNPADLDNDGHVGAADLAQLLAAWGRCKSPPAPCAADLDEDGTVGASDLAELLASWG